MKKFSINQLVLVVFIAILLACSSKIPEETLPSRDFGKEFNAYWYSGKAEINVYDLEQARYGAIHKGKAVRIFVTEDFLLKKQVKKESSTEESSASVLKMNFLKKFPTGIYDYSMMSSIFTPVDDSKYKKTIKSTTSSQEWCGHTYGQLNLEGDKYKFTGHSYFEAENDQNYNIDYAVLEDEIWNRMRIRPLNLPQGSFKMIPSTMHARLRHFDLKPQNVKGSLNLQVMDDQTEFYVYKLQYEDGRELIIHANSTFPYRITYWEETFESGFGPFKKRLTTKATLTKSIREAYWGQNTPDYEYLRKELGL